MIDYQYEKQIRGSIFGESNTMEYEPHPESCIQRKRLEFRFLIAACSTVSKEIYCHSYLIFALIWLKIILFPLNKTIHTLTGVF